MVSNRLSGLVQKYNLVIQIINVSMFLIHHISQLVRTRKLNRPSYEVDETEQILAVFCLSPVNSGYMVLRPCSLVTCGDQSRQVTTLCLDQCSSANCLFRDSFAPACISLQYTVKPTCMYICIKTDEINHSMSGSKEWLRLVRIS